MTHRYIFAASLRVARILVAASLLVDLGHAAVNTRDHDVSRVHRGRYLVQVAGCNDCHTPGYIESNGNIEETRWLTGSALGWRGPWGTTYPPNLRLVAQRMDESQWLVYARNQWRPPMPWFNLRVMSDGDLGCIYQYLHYLGPAGQLAPVYLQPGVEATTPVVTFGSPAKVPGSSSIDTEPGLR
jgi:hypothetical protein